MKNRKGFTLIELIVVIAILGILALLLVPSFMGYAKDAKQSVCESNMTSIQRAYHFQMAKQEKDEERDFLDKVMNNEFDDFSTAPKCPSGGIYYIINTGEEAGQSVFQVVCSEHSNVLGKIPTQILNQMIHFNQNVRDMDVTSDEFKKYYELYKESVEKTGGTAKNIGMFQSYVLNNNDELRNYLQYINGGSWPTLQVNGQTLYVQPYIDSHRSNSSGDIIIYASPNGNGNWNTNYIYDSNTGKWWTGKKSFSVSDKSFDQVKEKMQEYGWSEVSNPQDMVITGQIVMP
ncbi:prepilin-type N-terminal cleavage/methylation domain-containing protein [Dielma fastidiosa]|uniref:prepilin-type N-terminal cleavage/methylation domain-containing protein n=1 Tax=Dielma fastidiosa TaxID=1034346 RepID=UPI000E495213|nr:prepilin-type N-terminal cleavage/methylation domain-containing protein [Dielma fastidiosa]RHM99579.1 prepilin-type N-terminal cleavage/methylation domain-containing protein [Dielma fastidiosa]